MKVYVQIRNKKGNIVAAHEVASLHDDMQNYLTPELVANWVDNMEPIALYLVQHYANITHRTPSSASIVADCEVEEIYNVELNNFEWRKIS